MGTEPEYGSDIFEPRNRSSFGSQLTRSTGSHDRFDDSEINSYPPTYPGSADSINSQEPTLENELLYSNPMKTPDGKSNSVYMNSIDFGEPKQCISKFIIKLLKINYIQHTWKERMSKKMSE